MGAVAGFHEGGGFQVVFARVFEGCAAGHAIDEVALDRIDAVTGETFASVRVVEDARGLAEQFEGERALEIEFDVAFAAVEADEAEGVARVGGVGFVVARGVEDRSRAADEAADNLAASSPLMAALRFWKRV